jgi:hypothetical protein
MRTLRDIFTWLLRLLTVDRTCIAPPPPGVRCCLAAFWLAAGLAACGGGGGGYADSGSLVPGVAPPSATTTEAVPLAPITEPAQSTSARIGADGGSLTATSTKGVVYTLVVPPGALTETVEIRLTPIADLRVPSLTRGMLGAVQMEPTGLVFQRAATLRIGTAPAVKPGELLVGLGSANDGSGLGFKAATVVEGATEISVFHFSTGGAASATPEEVAAVPEAPAALGTDPREVRDIFFDKILRLWVAGVAIDTISLQAAGLFDTWFQLDIRPRLDDIARTPPTEPFSGRFWRAIDAYTQWIETRAWLERMGGEVERTALLATVDAENQPFVARLLAAEIDRALAACAAPSATSLASLRNLQFAKLAQLTAEKLNLATPAFRLDKATMLSLISTCLSPALDPIVLPSPLGVGQARSLDAQAKLVFNGRPNPVGAPFIFTVQPVGATLGQMTGRSDAGGRYTTVFTPTSNPVEFIVRACLVLDLLSVDEGSDVCISQTVASPLGLRILAGSLSQSLNTTTNGATVSANLTGFLRIGIDAAGAVSVLQSSGTQIVQTTFNEQSNACFDARLDRFVPIVLTETNTAAAKSVRYFTSSQGSGFAFSGDNTITRDQLVNRQINCDIVRVTSTETPQFSLFIMHVLQVERDASGLPVAMVLGDRLPTPGTVGNSLLTVNR